MKKKLVFLAVPLLISAFLSGCGENNHSSLQNTQRVFRVKCEKAEKRLFQKKLLVHMTAKPVYHANISAKSPGIIELFPAGGGTLVKQGDMLFQTDQFQLEANLEIAAQELSVAEATSKKISISVDIVRKRLEKAEIDLKRAADLYKINAISKDKYEQVDLTCSAEQYALLQAEAELEYAKAKVEQAKSDFSIAKRRLDDSVMKAPFDAKVVDTYAERWEHASSGQKVLRLESEQLTLSTLIGADLYSDIQVGKTMAVVRIPEIGYIETLPVTYKAAFVDPVSRTFEMKIDLPPNKRLVSGLLCEAEVILGSEEAYGLPALAFIPQTDGQFAIFSIQNNIAEKHIVEMGIKENGWAAIRNPPENVASLEFVVEGQSFLNNGAHVQVVK